MSKEKKEIKKTEQTQKIDTITIDKLKSYLEHFYPHTAKLLDEFDLKTIIYISKQTGLNPFLGHIIPVKYRRKHEDGTYTYDPATLIVTLKGYHQLISRIPEYIPPKLELIYELELENGLRKRVALQNIEQYAYKSIRLVGCFAKGKYNNEPVEVYVELQPFLNRQMWRENPERMLEKTAEMWYIKMIYTKIKPEFSALYSEGEVPPDEEQKTINQAQVIVKE